MFDFFKKRKKLSIWPNRASESVSSMGLLVSSLGFPFNEWKHPDLILTDYESSVIRPACHCNQIFAYRYLFEDHLIGEVMLGSALSIAREERGDFINSLEFGLMTLEESLKIIGPEASDSEDPINIVLARFSQMWEIVMCEDDGKEESFRESLREKTYKCLWHSRLQAINAFDPMIKNILIYNLSDIEQVSYRKDRSIFEEVLYRRSKYPVLFRHMLAPNAELLLEARRKAQEFAVNSDVKYRDSLVQLKHNLEDADNSGSEAIYNKFREYLDSTDDLRYELHLVGGEDCRLKLRELTEGRESIFNLVKASFVSYDNNFEGLMVELKKNYDGTYQKMLELPGIYRFVDDKEIPSFALTMDDDEFSKLKDSVEPQEFLSYLERNRIDINLPSEQKYEVGRKISLLNDSYL